MSTDAYASRLRMVFLSTLRSCFSRFLRALKKNNNNNNDNKQKFIVIVKTNMKAFETINFTCTVMTEIKYLFQEKLRICHHYLKFCNKRNF